uniref:Transposase Tc1-like domain-containing protein n=1 Tax=Paramormyrops kingsleyae TaxID=1676925 RepID=A0A3B3T0I3_9TELE
MGTQTLPKSGIPSKITERAARKIARELHMNPKQTARDPTKSLEAIGIKVHTSTVKRSRYNCGLYGRRVRRKSLLTTRHMAARLEYGKKIYNVVCILLYWATYNFSYILIRSTKS